MIPKSKLFAVSVLALLFLSMFAGLGVWQIKPAQAETVTVLLDTFESGTNFTLWTAVGSKSAGETCEVTQSSAAVKNGVWGSNFTANANETTEYVSVYETFTGRTDIYVESWMKVSGRFPASSTTYWWRPIVLYSSDWTELYALKINNASGTYRWAMEYWNVTTDTTVYNATPTLSLDTWYQVKLYLNVSDTQGIARLWIDSTLVLEGTDFNSTRGKTAVAKVSLGDSSAATYPADGVAHSIFYDDVTIYYETTTGGGPETGTIGYTSVGTDDNQLYAGYIYFYGPYPISVGTTANFSEIHLYTTSTGNARTSIFSGVNNEPSALVVEGSSQACSADSWNLFNIADTEYWSEGNQYFLGVQFSQHYMARTTYHYWYTRYKAWTYGAFPSAVSNLPVIHHECSLYANYTLSAKPFYSNVATNTTKETRPCEFDVKWRSNSTLDYSTFSWDQGTGVWDNTSLALSGSTDWHNLSKTLSAYPSTVNYKWIGNDTSGNTMTTPTYSFATIALITVPQFSQQSVNASRPSYPANFSILLTADYTLLYAYLEHNNTGVVQNSSAIALSGESCLANTTLTSNNTPSTLRYRWFGNTTEGWNVTNYYNLTIAEPVDGALNVTGNQIQKISTGEEVVLKGINLVGFTDTPTGFWANGQTFVESEVDRELKAMALWGYNNLRLHISVKWWNLGNVSNAYGTHDYRYNIKRTIQIANTYGIYVVVEGFMVLSIGDTGAQQTPLPFPPYLNSYEEAILTSEVDYIEYCKSVVSYLKNEPNFIFELWNEPLGNTDAKADWFRVARQATLEVRQISNTPIIFHWSYASYINYAWDAAYGMPWSDIPNIVYSAHIYRYWGCFPNNEYAYDDVKAVLQNYGFYDAIAVHNLAVYMGETGPHITDEATGDTEEEACYNNTLQILYKEWNVSVVAFWWRDLQPWRHIDGFTNLYPTTAGKISMAGMNKLPFTFSVGNTVANIYDNDTWSASWDSTLKRLTVTYSGMMQTRVFWNVSSLYPVNATLRIKHNNGTIYNAVDYYDGTTGLIRISGASSWLIGYALSEVTVTITSPINTTYTTPTVPVQVSASGGTIDTILWNCTFTNGTVVYANTVYTTSTSMTLGDETYIFNARANNTLGEWDEATVTFTVAIPATSSTTIGYQLGQGAVAAAGFMGIVMLLGMVYVAAAGKDVKYAVMLAVGEVLLLVTMLILSQLAILG